LQDVEGFLPVKWHMTWQDSKSVEFMVPRID